MQNGSEVTVRSATQDSTLAAEHTLNPRQVEIILQGGLIEDYKN
jgi:aconitate hydratase